MASLVASPESIAPEQPNQATLAENSQNLAPTRYHIFHREQPEQTFYPEIQATIEHFFSQSQPEKSVSQFLCVEVQTDQPARTAMDIILAPFIRILGIFGVVSKIMMEKSLHLLLETEEPIPETANQGLLVIKRRNNEESTVSILFIRKQMSFKESLDLPLTDVDYRNLQSHLIGNSDIPFTNEPLHKFVDALCTESAESPTFSFSKFLAPKIQYRELMEIYLAERRIIGPNSIFPKRLQQFFTSLFAIVAKQTPSRYVASSSRFAFEVVEIEAIYNPEIWNDYQQRKQQIRTEIQKEAFIEQIGLETPKFASDLEVGLNEGFLLHRCPSGIFLDQIVAKGFLASFFQGGRVFTFAEILPTVPPREYFKVLISRVCLGNPHIATELNKQQPRPPSKHSLITEVSMQVDKKDKQTEEKDNGEENIEKKERRLRAFGIYDRRQAYPEFVVTLRRFPWKNTFPQVTEEKPRPPEIEQHMILMHFISFLVGYAMFLLWEAFQQ